MKLLNSLTNKIEEIKPISGDQISIYSCGPTVYDHIHIGNLCSFIYADTLARVLRSQYRVKHVMNITDVDDKTIKLSQQKYPKDKPLEALKKLTSVYELSFMEDISNLNIYHKDYTFIRATDSIDLIQELITKLVDNGSAYISDDGIYFSISKYREKNKIYGKLVKLDLGANDPSKSRINNDEYDKETAHDFVLWKFKKDQEPSWDYSYQDKNYEGRPGWHIECSAMSVALLDQPFDIHTGGVDLKFPHHENEIAQSTTEDDVDKLANLFFHNEHLFINNQKMSKSLNNFYHLDDVINKISDPLAFRLLILQSHYRNRSDFSFINLESAYKRLLSIRSISSLRYQSDKNNSSKVYDFNQALIKIKEPLLNDLNTPESLAELSTYLNQFENTRINDNQIPEFIKFFEYLDDLFGLDLSNVPDLNEQQTDLLTQRLIARESKNWGLSDSIRQTLSSQGIGLYDNLDDQIWFYV